MCACALTCCAADHQLDSHRAPMLQGAVTALSSKKAMGVKMSGRLGKKDLRLRLGGAAQLASKGGAKVTFQQNVEAAPQEADGDRWSNDMFYKSGQATMPAPPRQAVPERPPSFLTTKSGSRRGATAGASGGAARALASAGILVRIIVQHASPGRNYACAGGVLLL